MTGAVMSKKDHNHINLGTDVDLLPFKRLITDKCGLSFKDNVFSNLSDAIEKRMASTQIHNRAWYLDTLMNNEREFQDLVSLLTINETYFMRESHHYTVLVDRLIPELLKKRKRINILSAGCSTGEEPYSIIISLINKFGPGVMEWVSVFAFDIHHGAIQRARRGVYGPNSFRDFDPELKNRYFMPVGKDGYELIPSLKKAVQFQVMNLGSGVYPDHIGNMDIIFYRNVSIYFQPETQKAVFAKLTNLLNDDGYLVTSSVETCMHNVGILFLVEIDGIYLYTKRFEVKMDYSKKPRPAPVRAVGKPTPLKTARPSTKQLAKKEKNPSELFEDALAEAKDKKFEKSLDTLGSLLKKDPTHAKAHTLKAAILINLKQIAEAEKICLKTLGLDEWNLESYLLLGIIANIKNEDKEAFKRFKGALYIQPDCWLAHFYLGELYYSMDQLDESYREYGVTLKLLQKDGIANNGLSFFPLSFSVEQLIHLCKHNLTKLKTRLQ